MYVLAVTPQTLDGRPHTTLFPLQIRQAEMELKKGENMIEHEAEIFSRPARTWFQTGKEKAKAEGKHYFGCHPVIPQTNYPTASVEQGAVRGRARPGQKGQGERVV